MCLVSEALSGAYIGVGSLGTRSEIAAELIRLRRHGGAEGPLAGRHRQRRGAADGGLHRAQYRLRPRQPAHAAAVREGDVYKVSGAKTWITHPARAPT
jgi:(2S)-methylsuccinyl-CoA dehydrogenase